MFTRVTLLAALLLLWLPGTHAATKPNVSVIFADDYERPAPRFVREVTNCLASTTRFHMPPVQTVVHQ